MSRKMFFINFLGIYLLLSIPFMFGVGSSITWVEEATILQKLNTSLFHGISMYFMPKLIFSFLAGLFLFYFVSLKKKA